MTGTVTTLTALLADRTQGLGAEHPSTLLTYSALTRWQAHTVDTATVTDSFTDLLEKMQRVLGPDHPTTGSPGARRSQHRDAPCAEARRTAWKAGESYQSPRLARQHGQ